VRLTGAYPAYVLDIAGNRINPAKEDGNLASIKTSTDNLDVALSTLATASKQDDQLNRMIERGTSPTIYNVTCTNADTEYSQALPASTKKFTVKARGGSLKICFTSGQSGTTYVLLEDGQSWSEDGIVFNGTLYFQSPAAGTIAEIIAWS